ncbi:MAG: DMT family transporter [Rhodospirillales bacterium]|nr:MAG: DMT family transporter [Rhodospirillales bacterium]
MGNHLLYAATVLIWGSTWYAIKLQLGTVDPDLSVAYRHVIASAILIVFCLATRRSLRFPARQHVFIAAQGLFLFCLNYWIFYYAAFHLTTGVMAVVFSLIMLMNILNGAVLFGSRVDRGVLAAAALGVIGLVLVFWQDLAVLDFGSGPMVGLGLSIVATYSASLGNMASLRNSRAGLPIIQVNALGMGYGALFMLILAGLRGAPVGFDFSPTYVGSLLWLAVLGSVVAFGCYLTLLARIGADRAAYAAVVFPIVALIISTILEAYVWTIPALIGVALILGGNLLVVARPKRHAAPRPQPAEPAG